MAFTKIVGAGIHTLSNVHTHNINSSGIITATQFVGPMENSSGISTFYDLKVTNNLTVEGTTTTLDTKLVEVDKVEILADTTNVAIAVTHTGDGDLVRLYDSTTQVVTVDDEGKVGIGENSPDALLHLSTGASTTCELRLQANNTGSGAGDRGRISVYSALNNGTEYQAGYVDIDRSSGTDDQAHLLVALNDGSSVVERLRIAADGDVGIGTNNPHSELEVYDAEFADITISSGRTTGNIGGLNFRKTDPGGAPAGIMTAQYFVNTDGSHFFYSQGSSKFQIGSDGDITFGVTASSTAVTSGNIKHISLGKDYWNGDRGHYNALRLLVYDNGVNDAYGFGISNGELEIQSQGHIGLYAGSAASNSKRDRRMYIDQTGDVIFGFNNSGATNSSNLFNMSLGGTYHDTNGSYPKLSLWHDGTDHMGFGVSPNQLDYILTSTSYDHVFYGGNAGTTEFLRIKGNSGNVGIGTDDPDQELHVMGQIKVDAGAYGRVEYARDGTNLWSAGLRTSDDFFFFRESGSGNVIFQHGNVGIGTDNPDGILHVHNSTAGSVTAAGDANELVLESSANVGMSFLTANDSISRIKFGDTTATNRGIFLFSHDDQSFRFQHTSNERLRITSSGTVNIGGDYTSTTSRLRINSTSYPETTEYLAVFKAGVANGNRFKNRYIKIRNNYTGSVHGGVPIVWEANADGSNNKAYGAVVTEGNGDIRFLNAAATSEKAIGTDLLNTISEKFRITNTGAINCGHGSAVNLHGSTTTGINLNGNNNSGQIIANASGNRALIIGRQADYGQVIEFFQGTNTNEAAITIPAADSFGIETAGTERLRILSNGRIGINTNSATSALQIYAADLGEGTAKGQIFLKDTADYNATPTGGIVFQGHHTSGKTSQAIFAGIRGFKANTADGDYDGCLGFDVRKSGAVAYEAMRINEHGQASIGAEPSSGKGLLNIKPGSGDDSYTKFRRAADFDGTFDGTAIDTRNSANNASKDLIVRFSKLALWANTSEKLRITSGGQVNIGGNYDQTTYALQVTKNSADVVKVISTGGDVLILESSTASSRTTLKFNTNGNDWELGARGSSGNPNNHFYLFDNAAADYRMVVNPVGNIGIGTANPGSKLSIQSGDLAIKQGSLYLSSDRDAAVPGSSYGYQVISGYKVFPDSNSYVNLAYVGHSHSIQIQYMCIENGNTALGGSHGEIFFHTTYGNSQQGISQQAYTVAMNGGRITSGVSFQYQNGGAGSHGGNYVLKAKVSYSGTDDNLALHYTIKGISSGNMYV